MRELNTIEMNVVAGSGYLSDIVDSGTTGAVCGVLLGTALAFGAASSTAIAAYTLGQLFKATIGYGALMGAGIGAIGIGADIIETKYLVNKAA